MFLGLQLRLNCFKLLSLLLNQTTISLQEILFVNQRWCCKLNKGNQLASSLIQQVNNLCIQKYDQLLKYILERNHFFSRTLIPNMIYSLPLKSNLITDWKSAY
jgi:hypothetical protein